MPFLGSLFGQAKEPEKTPKQQLRQAQRDVSGFSELALTVWQTKKQTRGMERELKRNEAEQKKIERDIKKHAAAGRMDCAKVCGCVRCVNVMRILAAGVGDAAGTG